MAADEKPSSINEAYADRLSAGAYTWKKGREIVVSFGGMIGGWFAGKGIAKLIQSETTAKELRFFGQQFKISNHQLGGAIGAVAGSVIGSFVLGYEHWRKEESSKLGIDEINNDVANMKIRQRTDPELLKENDRLRAMLEETSSHADKIGKPAASFTEKAQSAPAAERSI